MDQSRTEEVFVRVRARERKSFDACQLSVFVGGPLGGARNAADYFKRRVERGPEIENAAKTPISIPETLAA